MRHIDAQMKKLFLFLLTLCLFACQPSTAFTYVIRDQSGHSVKIVPIYLDAKWDNNEVGAIEVAINDWNVALGGEMKLEVKDEHYTLGVSDPGLMIVKVSQKDKIANRDDVLIALGWFDRNSGRRIYMVRDRLIFRGKNVETPWELSDVSAVARHEIGHALGSRHLERGYGLMAPGFDRDEYQCVDKEAIDAVAAYQHLSTDNMKWCQH